MTNYGVTVHHFLSMKKKKQAGNKMSLELQAVSSDEWIEIGLR
jgi:hypothetical protein